MTKIKKNLSDDDMLAGWQEEGTFETDPQDETPVRKTAATVKKGTAQDYTSAFFTPELQEAVGKALLELKVKLYNEGIVDFKLKVSSEGKQVILTAVPETPKKKPAGKGR
ncbi:MAG TPA: hypothetical protein PKA28_11515 [Methylomusa anaerophila]|uniref:Uncharacterized protein n=1 Tax=Methylomusa anaerophila TaxID=1930071 RepID=A0A348AJD7_9FIRM|nr:hypothetical protein [Methylomusa anaerophila]BBB91185.1 hypothetical protein MAMMFC1_01856 [Methylomusa anaerophila]HML89062.1 hypothetical protein [Methylomusa anaerophila]